MASTCLGNIFLLIEKGENLIAACVKYNVCELSALTEENPRKFSTRCIMRGETDAVEVIKVPSP